MMELLVSAGVAAALTWILWKEDKPAEKKSAPVEEAPAEPEAPAPKPDDVVLLEEIRDLLKQKN